MSQVFQLGTSTTSRADSVEPTPFWRWGYRENPFPAAGVSSRVLYTEHMQPQLGEINHWLLDTQRACSVEQRDTLPIVRPLALRGALGVGKTHFMTHLQQGLSGAGNNIIVASTLTASGMTRLLLADLLVGALQDSGGHDLPSLPGGRSPVPLLDRLIDLARREPVRARAAVASLGSSSLLGSALDHLLGSTDASALSDHRVWLGKWLIRAYTTPAQRSKLGLSSGLSGEGQAIAAVADLLRLGWRLGLVDTFYFMLDQLEELWRKGVISEGRRSRFLTDLRSLVDCGLSGAPISVLLAWNTEVVTSFAGQQTVDRLAEDYRALWRRLETLVELPGLRRQDIWPFAGDYLDEADEKLALPRADAQRKQLRGRLERASHAVLASLEQDRQAQLGADRFAVYKVLQAWRRKAEELVVVE